jgi:hypothetical protein
MIRVDVCRLDFDQALRVLCCRPETLPQEFGDNFNDLGV